MSSNEPKSKTRFGVLERPKILGFWPRKFFPGGKRRFRARIIGGTNYTKWLAGAAKSNAAILETRPMNLINQSQLLDKHCFLLEKVNQTELRLDFGLIRSEISHKTLVPKTNTLRSLRKI